MKKVYVKAAILVSLCLGSVAQADMFGTGINQFTIDFLPISGSTNPSSGISQGAGSFTFVGVTNDYCIGKYEITYDQWSKFIAENGAPTGFPSNAYDGTDGVQWTGANLPTNGVSWLEAAQFVNWLNTNTGNQAAYNFTGTPGTSNYTFALWNATEADGGTNLFRHKDAKYYVPTENEWVKAAYWNRTTLVCQTYSSIGNVVPTTINFRFDQHYAPYAGPWNFDSGSLELNGTYNMMGNQYELTESQYNNTGGYSTTAYHGIRGGNYQSYSFSLGSGQRSTISPYDEPNTVSFRVASKAVPVTYSLSGIVNFLDFGGDRTIVPVVVELGNGISPITLNLDDHGYFTILNVPVGTYNVRIKATHWLAKMTNGVVVSGNTDMGTVPLINGDVVENNEVDFSDINAARTAYGSFPGDVTWNEMADVDGSGEVDFSDINIVRSNYGAIGN